MDFPWIKIEYRAFIWKHCCHISCLDRTETIKSSKSENLGPRLAHFTSDGQTTFQATFLVRKSHQNAWWVKISFGKSEDQFSSEKNNMTVMSRTEAQMPPVKNNIFNLGTI